eukprot:TRINITY_DN8543_c0_g1_i1.p1 TRINITY_DN8543_c0_g1~~TRINITY_DN8543_c0_g1_i1.p1  ORF type:complete len:1013 (+),score=247.95 TRINITY_DN8543_c0_g1_i1:97-3135(+)
MQYRGRAAVQSAAGTASGSALAAPHAHGLSPPSEHGTGALRDSAAQAPAERSAPVCTLRVFKAPAGKGAGMRPGRQPARDSDLAQRERVKPHMRIDPADGNPYTFQQFVECYGKAEGARRFGEAQMVGSAEEGSPEADPGPAGAAGEVASTADVAALAETLRELLLPLGQQGLAVDRIESALHRTTGRKIDMGRFGIPRCGEKSRMMKQLLELPQVQMQIEVGPWGVTPTAWVRGFRPGGSAAVPHAVQVAAAAAEAAAPPPAYRDSAADHDGCELRIDPIDGLAHTLFSFQQAYGDAAESRWERAESAPPGAVEGSGRDRGTDRAGKRCRESDEATPPGIDELQPGPQVEIGKPVSTGQLGVVVEAHGFKNTPGLNGTRGVVFREQRQRGDLRFVVLLPPPFGVRALRAENLKVVARSVAEQALRLQAFPREELVKLDPTGVPRPLSEFTDVYEAHGRRMWDEAEFPPELRGKCPWAELPPAQGAYLELGNLALSASLLLVGEANFSLAAELGSKLHLNGLSSNRVVATALEHEFQLLDKYPESKENMDAFRQFGGAIASGVDATQADHLAHCARLFPSADPPKIEAVWFHFPEIADIRRAGSAPTLTQRVAANRLLLEEFFGALTDCDATRGGRVFVTLKRCPPFSHWDLVGCARKKHWVLVGDIPFRPEMYPQYHFRTHVPSSRSESVNIQMADAHVHEFRYSYPHQQPAPAEPPRGSAPGAAPPPPPTPDKECAAQEPAHSPAPAAQAPPEAAAQPRKRSRTLSPTARKPRPPDQQQQQPVRAPPGAWPPAGAPSPQDRQQLERRQHLQQQMELQRQLQQQQQRLREQQQQQRLQAEQRRGAEAARSGEQQGRLAGGLGAKEQRREEERRAQLTLQQKRDEDERQRQLARRTLAELEQRQREQREQREQQRPLPARLQADAKLAPQQVEQQAAERRAQQAHDAPKGAPRTEEQRGRQSAAQPAACAGQGPPRQGAAGPAPQTAPGGAHALAGTVFAGGSMPMCWDPEF